MRLWGLGIIFVAVGLIGLIGSGWAIAARLGAHGLGFSTGGLLIGTRGGPTCPAPALPGQTVNVILSDTGGGMMGNHMMNVADSPSTVASGDVSLIVWNAGMMVHEFIVLPLPSGGAGTRPVGPHGQVSEAGSLGEASRSCGDGAGDGIAPGAASWTTLRLSPGPYELLCNLPGHYAMGMFTELDVR